jgi:hypothetical protein
MIWILLDAQNIFHCIREVLLDASEKDQGWSFDCPYVQIGIFVTVLSYIILYLSKENQCVFYFNLFPQCMHAYYFIIEDILANLQACQ